MSASISIAPILRKAWPSHTAKHAARELNVSPRTVHGWLAERCCPPVGLLLRMADRNDKLRAELIKRLALQEGYADDGMAKGVLPVDGEAPVSPHRKTNGPRARVAKEG